VAYFLLVVLVIGAYAWVRKIRIRAQEREGLRWFRYRRELTQSMTDVWSVDFVSMTLETIRRDYESTTKPQAILYAVQRRNDGRWQAQMTPDCRNRELTSARAELAEGSRILHDTLITQIASLEKRDWEDLDPDIASPLESQFQRFVRHYRAG
jgi:hypothetical protein